MDNASGFGSSEPVQVNFRGVHLAVETSTIGHSFFGGAVDYLLDQHQMWGGGGLLPSVPINWDTNGQFALTVSAPAGKRFLVHLPPGGGAVGFRGFLWWESTGDGSGPQGGVTASFSGPGRDAARVPGEQC